jgi:hypothetical protein
MFTTTRTQNITTAAPEKFGWLSEVSTVYIDSVTLRNKVIYVGKSLWRWCSSTNIIFLDIYHHPLFIPQV